MYTTGLRPSPATLLPKSNNPKTPILSLAQKKPPKISFSIHCKSSKPPPNPYLQTATKAAAIVLAAAFSLSKFHPLPPVKAEPPPTTTPLTQFLESNTDAVHALKSLLQQKLESHEDLEASKILDNLISAQPDEPQWMFLKARLLGEIGRVEEARHAFEKILAVNPLSFEALFENALLMDRNGEDKESVINRLEEALKVAVEEKKTKEARDVRLIIAQFEFLQKNVDGALGRYDELAREDPSDFRPYFCKGMIFSLLDRNEEAREEFAKYRELSPKKFEVEGYLRTPLSKTKLFGTD